MEAWDGIEPTNKGFADPRLTTWLPRLKSRRTLLSHNSAVNFLFSSDSVRTFRSFVLARSLDRP